MQNHFSSIALSLLVGGGIISCDAVSIAERIVPEQEMSRTPSSPASSSSFATLEQSIHKQINEYRRSRNLPPLTLNSQISAQALAHSQAMASGKVPFSHDGFDQRVQIIRRSIPYRAAAENVAFNQGYSNPDVQAVQGWIKSAGHRVNIEGQYDLTGIGISRNSKGEYYFTQIFIRSR
ncbi:CAP domain-containing protein [Gloeocapsopsis crepidinum LEGE 06123]|uniref:CAP domain-containing protein n=1 Tax=Gloeocapsopsis crepidinum LEGE 06123 TaxID=588587 RepID=A0ABR9UP68_9CHRO|nr:CAP domain-containing protein [Gloeocapsopsis crepidinum]MBE9189830.1 CAP domain-containing protein [Gloeocapsopsis crepidinum LEGE 06123]